MYPSKPFSEYTKGEQDFIIEMTKRCLVNWADHQIQFRCFPQNKYPDQEYLYLRVAQEKGWISKSGDRVLATGFKVAAAFLRR